MENWTSNTEVEPYLGLDKGAAPYRFIRVWKAPWYKDLYTRLRLAYYVLRGWY